LPSYSNNLSTAAPKGVLLLSGHYFLQVLLAGLVHKTDNARKQFLKIYIFGGIECVGHSFVYIAYFAFLGEKQFLVEKSLKSEVSLEWTCTLYNVQCWYLGIHFERKVDGKASLIINGKNCLLFYLLFNLF
jgi:hypothetical protein